MGLITTGASLLSVAGGVASTVFSLGSGVLKTGGKILGSTTGKLALGAGVIAVLTSDPKKGGFFGKIKTGFGNLLDAITGKVKESATEATVNAAAVAMNAGTQANELTASIAESAVPEEQDTGPVLAEAPPEEQGQIQDDREYE